MESEKFTFHIKEFLPCTFLFNNKTGHGISWQRLRLRTALRYLTEEVDCILVPWQLTLINAPDFNLGLEPNRIDSILPKWRDYLLSINQWLIESNSSVSTLSISY